MRLRKFGWLFVALTIGAMGCDDKSAEKDLSQDSKKSSKKKKKDEKKAEPSAAAKTATAAPSAAPAAPTCGSEKTIPTIPSTRSNPPTVAEWNTACSVNTQGANSEGQDCTSKIVREWLNVTCRNRMTGVENMEGFGSKGSDYFEMVKLPNMVSYVVRLRKGHSQKVRMCRTDQRASLFVSWPSSKEQPTIVAVGRGPKCDSK